MSNNTKQNETCVSSNLEPYLAKDGDAHPYASLLTDLTFKKAFNPDVESSRKTLVAMLNDILGPQLDKPIKNVFTRNVEQNESGSCIRRTAIFDLHCEDDQGHFIEIEVQIREMDNFMKRLGYYASQIVSAQGVPGKGWNFAIRPAFVIAFTRFTIFEDDLPIHRLTTMDMKTHERLLDSYNYTVVELSKVLPHLPTTEEEKWLFLFRYLNQLKMLPPEVDGDKFGDLILCCKISNLTKEEFEEYQKVFNAEYDHNALKAGFFKEFAEEINQKVEEASLAKAREMAKGFRDDGVSMDIIVKRTGLTKEEILAL